ncbi:MAG: putative ABC transporter permease [Clostridia bacterium]|nr:putative ABC transporter permease [Clostridia bacterium]
MNTNFLELCTYFVIYSFLGWCLETTYRSFCEKKLINTGFLYGPFCPIYGSGAIIMLLGLNQFKGKYILLFFIGFFILSIWEYLVGWFIEKTFNTKYWDYSDHKFNIKGRVCLTNSFFWGILGVVFINLIHPFILGLVSGFDDNIVGYLTIGLLVIIIIDTIISVVKVKNIKSTLQKIEELNKEIREKIKLIKENKKYPDKQKMTENVQKIVQELKMKRNRIMRNLYRHVYRLKKTFPAINTKEITTILNKKNAVKKDKEKS